MSKKTLVTIAIVVIIALIGGGLYLVHVRRQEAAEKVNRKQEANLNEIFNQKFFLFNPFSAVREDLCRLMKKIFHYSEYMSDTSKMFTNVNFSIGIAATYIADALINAILIAALIVFGSRIIWCLSIIIGERISESRERRVNHTERNILEHSGQ